VADTLTKLNLTKAVRAVSYDLNFNAYPDTIEYTSSVPMIYFYPATKKLEKPIKYDGKVLAGEMLVFIE
jgi:hypothetical protein